MALYVLGARQGPIHTLSNVYNRLPEGRGSFTPILNQQREVPVRLSCHGLDKTLSNLIKLDLL